MSWGTFVYKGVTYDLTHLDEYEFTVLDSQKVERRIAVTFGDHCFTRDPEPGDDPGLVYPASDRRPGYFCIERYSLSRGIRDHIAYAAKGEVWNVGGDHYAAVTIVDQSGKPVQYGIIFSLDRVRGLDVDLQMRVRSAHPIDAKIVTYGSVRFRHLVTLRMKGERPGRITNPGRKRPRNP